MTPARFVATEVTEAFKRIRTLIYVMLLMCGIIATNFYLENFSFDTAVMIHHDLFKASLEDAARKVSGDNNALSQ